jgi:hypothetical protein
MRRIILACALAGILSVPAKADETVKWRHVHHLTGLQTQQVGDADGHTLNLFHLPGIAFFPDGSIGTTLVIGTSDVTSGVGATINGYYTVNFADGSALWFKYTGTGKISSPNNTVKGTAIVIGGKGRYAGAKGDGTFEGAATSGPDAFQYIDNVITIKK